MSFMTSHTKSIEVYGLRCKGYVALRVAPRRRRCRIATSIDCTKSSPIFRITWRGSTLRRRPYAAR